MGWDGIGRMGRDEMNWDRWAARSFGFVQLPVGGASWYLAAGRVVERPPLDPLVSHPQDFPGSCEAFSILRIVYIICYVSRGLHDRCLARLPARAATKNSVQMLIHGLLGPLPSIIAQRFAYGCLERRRCTVKAMRNDCGCAPGS